MTPSKQQTRNEESKMRRVRNQNIHSASPALMFAAGVESIVSEHMVNPRNNNVEKKADKQQRAAAKPESHGNFFGLLMRQFANLY
jgi:hypothetical protein